MKKPKIIVCCGSSRYCQEMAVCAWYLERDENVIAMGLHLLPWWYPNLMPDHLAEHEGVADIMDDRHLRKIDLSNGIFVVNKNDYIGESTTREIEYTKTKGLPIRWYSHDPIGQKVEEALIVGLEMAGDKKPDQP